MNADRVATPAYVYELARVREAHRRLSGFLPAGTGLLYSVKANPHPAILRELRALGAEAEVSSPGELQAAVEAGFPPDGILCTGPGKRDADVAAALAAGVTHFSVDSPYALDQVDRLAGAAGLEASCLLRVNDDSPAGGQRLTMSGVASPFGADAGWIEAEAGAFAGRGAARVDGLHLYMGSQLTGEDRLIAQFDQAIRTAARTCEALRITPAVLDLGGGFGAPFARAGTEPDFPALAGELGARLDKHFPGWREGRPRVVFESGRYLVATSGRLLVRVLDAKVSLDRQVVILESGINHLGGVSGLRRVPEIAPTLVTAVPGEPIPDTLVTGPLCTPLDIWSRRAALPPMRPGDLVEVPNVGAYGLTASLLAFLGHPAPAEVVLDDGEIREVTRLLSVRAAVPFDREE